MVVIFIFLYILAQILLGIYASRKIHNEADFLIAGRKVPNFLLVVSLFSTWFGAETIMGTTGAVFEHGLAGSRADPVGYFVCLLLLGLLIAPRLWKPHFLTLGDFFRERYGPFVEKLVIIILFVSSLIWASAQIRAFGQILKFYTEWTLPTTMVLGFLLAATYCLLGGLLGDILTDFLQGVILIVGLLAIIYFSYLNVLSQSPQNFDLLLTAERLSWVMPGESWSERIERWSVPILGSLIAQESVTRILSCKSARHAQLVSWTAAGIYLVVGTVPVAIGLLAPALVTEPVDGEQVITLVAEKTLPPWAVVIFLGALVSAILSTVDSVLISGGGLISHNFVVPFLGLRSEKSKLLSSRICLLLMGFLSLMVALGSDGIYELVQLASSWGTAGIVVISLFGLWSHWGGVKAGSITLLAGVVIMTLFQMAIPVKMPFLATVGLCILIYVGLGWWERQQKLPS